MILYIVPFFELLRLYWNGEKEDLERVRVFGLALFIRVLEGMLGFFPHSTPHWQTQKRGKLFAVPLGNGIIKKFSVSFLTNSIKRDQFYENHGRRQ